MAGWVCPLAAQSIMGSLSAHRPKGPHRAPPGRSAHTSSLCRVVSFLGDVLPAPGCRKGSNPQRGFRPHLWAEGLQEERMGGRGLMQAPKAGI